MRTESGTAGSTVYLGKLYQHKVSNNTRWQHYGFNGQLVMWRQTTGQGSSTTRFLLADHLGGTSTALSNTGVLVSDVRYGPWGNERWASGALPTEYRYTGQRADATLGIYDYRARYYDPTIVTHKHPTGGWQGARIDIYDATGNVICSPCGANTRRTAQAANGGDEVDAVRIEFPTDYFAGHSPLPLYQGPTSALMNQTVYFVNKVGTGRQVQGATVTGTAFLTTSGPAHVPSYQGHVNSLQISGYVIAGGSGGAVVWESGGQLYLVGINNTHAGNPALGSFATLASHIP